MNNFSLKDNYILDFLFTKRYNKLEKNFLLFISEKLEQAISTTLAFSIEEYISLSKISQDDLILFFNNIQKKTIFYKITSKNSEVCGSFPLISSFSISKNRISITLSKEFISFYDSASIFYSCDAKSFIKFEEKNSLSFFLKVFNSRDEKLFFTIDALKEFINLEENYERFYDFERFVLKKIVDDINENSRYKIIYEKVKKGEGINSKIIGINIKFQNPIPNSNRVYINSLIKKYSSKIDNFIEFFNLLETLLTKFSKEDLEEILIEASLENSSSSFYENIEKKSQLKSNIKYSLIRKNKIYSSNIVKIQSFILKELRSSEVPQNLIESLFPHPILADLFKIKIGESKIYKKEEFKFVLYKEASFTQFSIYISNKK